MENLVSTDWLTRSIAGNSSLADTPGLVAVEMSSDYLIFSRLSSDWFLACRKGQVRSKAEGMWVVPEASLVGCCDVDFSNLLAKND